MGIDEITPSQLAPTMGTIAAGSTVSAASSKGNNSPATSANGNSPTKSQDQNSPNQAAPKGSSTHSTNDVQTVSAAKSTSEPAMDFEPHSPEFQETFAGLETGLDLTVGSFSFFVNNLGTQDLTEPRQLATAAPDSTSTTVPTTADPSVEPVSLSILFATTMSTQELNKWLDSLGDKGVESTFTINQIRSDGPLKDTFDCGISVSDFTEPEIQIDSSIDMQTCETNNISREVHRNSNDIEMSTIDELVTNQSPPEGPFDCRTNSDMSLGESSEQAMEVESTFECPQSIPRHVCVLFTEASATAAIRRPTEFPCTVTMPDGVRQLTITAEMAEKADKAITECTMMPPSSTSKELLTFNYFNWQE